MRTTGTVIVGAGQAGLAASYHLSERGCPHVLLERARVAERWRSERWDSLRFQFPNTFVRLPGYPYDGDAPESFMHRNEVVRRLETYARRIAAPVETGVNVERLQPGRHTRFELATSAGPFGAEHVIVATGPYQVPVIPDCGARLPGHIRQLTASRYTSARALPDGAVLVVGSGGSGCQIVEDLVQQGRETLLAVSPHRRIPRQFRDRDITYWLEETGALDRPPSTSPDLSRAPLLTGVDGGYEVSVAKLADKGVKLIGRVVDASGSCLTYSDTVTQDIDFGDRARGHVIASIEAALSGDAPPGPPTRASDGTGTRVLDLDGAGVSSVIWATGYSVDFSWIDFNVLDERGRPIHTRGVTAVPGLMFLGLFGLHTVRSSFLWGVGADAEHLAAYIDHSESDPR